MENKTNLSDAPICSSYSFITFSIALVKNWKVTGAVLSKIKYTKLFFVSKHFQSLFP